MHEFASSRSQPFSAPGLSLGPLMTLAEISRGDPTDGLGVYDARQAGCLAAMARHVVEVLNAPNPDLGRAGVVCPFTTEAVNRHALLLTASTIAGDEQDRLTAEMELLRDAFTDAELFKASVPDIYRAIVVVFPYLSAPAGADLIERVQKALKPSYVERGLMIGEFYPGCPAPGLHNPAFRPFQTPVVSLAVRHMTLFDAPFMVQDERFVESYCRRFGESGMKRISALRSDRDPSGRGAARDDAARRAAG